MNEKVFADLVESIKQAGQIRRARKMSASEAADSTGPKREWSPSRI